VTAAFLVDVYETLVHCDFGARGAVAAGVTAVQIARSGAQERDGFPVIRSLMELVG
jgi:hypothetical protein